MLPSKVMPYLLRLAAPLTDSSIVQMKTYKGKVLFFQLVARIFGGRVLFRMASNTQDTKTETYQGEMPQVSLFKKGRPWYVVALGALR